MAELMAGTSNKTDEGGRMSQSSSFGCSSTLGGCFIGGACCVIGGACCVIGDEVGGTSSSVILVPNPTLVINLLLLFVDVLLLMKQRKCFGCYQRCLDPGCAGIDNSGSGKGLTTYRPR
eukprot:9220176-Ditylum_brightwellii.AAC.1